MEIKKAVFVKSASDAGGFVRDGKREVAFAGKSNVGKSTLINMLANNGKLAKTSGTPGKTRLINFFLINDSFYVVDLPGYGFASVPKVEKDKWGKMMDGYFSSGRNIATVVILMDIRHKPTEEDRRMVEFCEYYSIDYVIAATKADKIAKTKRKAECEKIRKEIPSVGDRPIIPVSQDGFGKDLLLREIGDRL